MLRIFGVNQIVTIVGHGEDVKKHWGTNRYIAIKKNNWERHIFVKMANEHLKEVEGTTLLFVEIHHSLLIRYKS